MAQRWPAPKPRLAQEEFDEAVKTNIEDFDMTPEEAVKSAVEEFKVQGYDLSGVLKQAGGGNTDEHPITVATLALEAADGDVAATAAALASLQAALAPGAAEAQEQNAVALKAKSLRPALRAVSSLSSSCTPAAAAPATPEQSPARSALLLSLAVARQLLSMSLEMRDLFDDAIEPSASTAGAKMEGGAVVVEVLRKHAGDREVQAAAAGLAEAAALKEEQNKESLVNAGFGTLALALVSEVVAFHAVAATRPAAVSATPPPTPAEPSEATSAEAHAPASAAAAASMAAAAEASERVSDLDVELVVNCCSALRLLVTADDDRPPSSAAFKNARTLAKDGAAAQVLLSALKALSGLPGAACAVLLALKMFAANDEICKEVAEGGGVLAILAALKAWQARNADVARAALGALRQLSNSDAVKKMLAENGGIEQILAIISSHPTTDDVLEPAIGLLVNMMLRLPEVATKVADAGAIDVVLEVMGSRPAAGQVQRQCCMALRNLSVRNPEHRPVILEKGGEALLRAAKAKHPKTCGDVGGAALRDLGLDNYNDDATLLHPERMVY